MAVLFKDFIRILILCDDKITSVIIKILLILDMPAKKVIKASKVASKIDTKKQAASKSIAKSSSKSTPKSAVK
jgi:hypothetical protein